MSILYQLYMALDVCSFLLLKPFTQSFWNYLEYHLCSESLLLQLSVVSPFFDSFNSWLIFSSSSYMFFNKKFQCNICLKFMLVYSAVSTMQTTHFYQQLTNYPNFIYGIIYHFLTGWRWTPLLDTKCLCMLSSIL